MATEPLDLDALRAWYTPCPAHDYGESTAACTCPKGDPRMVAPRLVAEVERVRVGWEHDQEVVERTRSLLTESRAEVERLTALTSTCTCYDGNPQNCEGPEADCAVHGAVRAFNEAQAEIAGLRLDLATLQRTLCELSTPAKPKDGGAQDRLATALLSIGDLAYRFGGPWDRGAVRDLLNAIHRRSRDAVNATKDGA
jgi:hypothetical protein